MSNKIIPGSVKLAAKRGFVRTAAQSLSAAIPTGLITVALTADWALAVGLGALGAASTALLAGAASALTIVSKGIPDEYTNAGVDQQHAAHSD